MAFKSGEMSTIKQVAVRVWGQVIGPHPRLTSPEERRGAWLLSIFILAHIFLVIILLSIANFVFVARGLGTIWDDPDIQGVFAGLGLIALAFGLIRGGRYRLGMLLYIFIVLIVALVVPFFSNLDASIALFSTAVIAVLLAAIAFPPRWAAAVLALIMIWGALQLVFFPLPVQTVVTLLALLFVNLVVGVLILMLVYYQNSVEQERRALLQESEERYRTFIQQTSEGIFFTDEQGCIIEWNRALEDITGLKHSDVIGVPVWDIQRRLMPQARIPAQNEAAFQSAFLETLNSESSPWLNRVIEAGYVDASGVLHQVETRMFPIRSRRGRRLGNFARDISQRKRAEEALHRLNQELEQRVQERTAALEAKNRELQTFSYTVSHDLKAPLRGIDGYSRLLEEIYAQELNDEGLLFLRNIRSSVTNMGDLINDLLAYSREEQRRVTFSQVDLNDTIDRILAEFRTLGGDLQIEFVTDVSCKMVYTDPQGLELILRNLVDNAVKFTRQAVAPRVEIGGREQGNGCLLWVRDNGVGFDMKHIDRIFEIFQRLNRAEDYPGTGIGLAIVRKAAERIGGRTWADSQPGEGATFYVEIPNPGI
jgi:PAS domain S-box-containing protein